MKSIAADLARGFMITFTCLYLSIHAVFVSLIFIVTLPLMIVSELISQVLFFAILALVKGYDEASEVILSRPISFVGLRYLRRIRDRAATELSGERTVEAHDTYRDYSYPINGQQEDRRVTFILRALFALNAASIGLLLYVFWQQGAVLLVALAAQQTTSLML
jgi:hypothetical protein